MTNFLLVSNRPQLKGYPFRSWFSQTPRPPKKQQFLPPVRFSDPGLQSEKILGNPDAPRRGRGASSRGELPRGTTRSAGRRAPIRRRAPSAEASSISTRLGAIWPLAAGGQGRALWGAGENKAFGLRQGGLVPVFRWVTLLGCFC